MLAIPAFQARTQTALFRAGNKPPLEVVVANLENRKSENCQSLRYCFFLKVLFLFC